MKHLLAVLFILLFLPTLDAQVQSPKVGFWDRLGTQPTYSKGDWFVYTRPFSSGAISGLLMPRLMDQLNRHQRTLWIGSEYFMYDRMSIDLMFGYVDGKVPTRFYENVSFFNEPYFLDDRLNFKSRFALRVFPFRHFYIGVHTTFNRIQYGGQQEVVLGWEDLQDEPLSVPNYTGWSTISMRSYLRDVQPSEIEMVNQRIVQNSYATQLIFGLSRSLDRVQVEVGVSLGRYYFLNKVKEGSRSAIVPDKSLDEVPDRLHIKERYTQNSTAFLFKVGYCINHNSLSRFKYDDVE